jgi:hypothetical protein
MSDGGKGSSARPYSISREQYSNNWDAIFKKDQRVIEDQKNEDEEFDRIKVTIYKQEVKSNISR